MLMLVLVLLPQALYQAHWLYQSWNLYFGRCGCKSHPGYKSLPLEALVPGWSKSKTPDVKIGFPL